MVRLRAMHHEDIKEEAPLALAALAGELTILVDRVQADWDQCGYVRMETAQQLHELRELAERMLQN